MFSTSAVHVGVCELTCEDMVLNDSAGDVDDSAPVHAPPHHDESDELEYDVQHFTARMKLASECPMQTYGGHITRDLVLELFELLDQDPCAVSSQKVPASADAGAG